MKQSTTNFIIFCLVLICAMLATIITLQINAIGTRKVFRINQEKSMRNHQIMIRNQEEIKRQNAEILRLENKHP